MLDLGKAWPTVVAIASTVLAVAGFVQTTLTIIKSRYELRKLRAEDQKLRAKTKPRTELIREAQRPRDISDYYYERLDADLGDLSKWIVITTVLALTGLSYVYLTLQIYKNSERIHVAKAELSILQEANAGLKDALALIHSLHNRQQKQKDGAKEIP
jgi:hypothetical protein